jgi:hypothetical protein
MYNEGHFNEHKRREMSANQSTEVDDLGLFPAVT